MRRRRRAGSGVLGMTTAEKIPDVPTDGDGAASAGERPVARRTGPAAAYVLPCLLVVGFACSRFGTTAGAEEGMVGYDPAWIALKLTKALVYVVLAVFFKTVRFSAFSRRLVVASAVLFAVAAAVFCSVEFARVESTSLSLFYIAASGANDALSMFAFMMFMAMLPNGPLLLLSGFALNYAFWLCFAGLSGGVPPAVELIARTVGMGVLVWVAFRGAPRALRSGDASPGDAAGAPVFGSGSVPPLPACAFAGLVLSTVAGFFVSLPLPGASTGLFGDVAHTLSVILLVLLAVVYALAPAALRGCGALYAAVVLCAAGCLLVPVAGADGATMQAGVTVVRIARLLFEACFWVLAVMAARGDERSGALAVGVSLAVNTYYGGTLLVLAFGEAALSSLAATTYAALVALAAVCLCAVVLGAFRPTCALVRTAPPSTAPARRDPDSAAAPLPEQVAPKGPGGQAAGSVAERLGAFDARLLRFVEQEDLGEREAAILVEVVHGHSGEAVGERLGYSRDAVKFSLAKIYAKAGVSSKQELLKAIEDIEVP